MLRAAAPTGVEVGAAREQPGSGRVGPGSRPGRVGSVLSWAGIGQANGLGRIDTSIVALGGANENDSGHMQDPGPDP